MQITRQLQIDNGEFRPMNENCWNENGQKEPLLFKTTIWPDWMFLLISVPGPINANLILLNSNQMCPYNTLTFKAWVGVLKSFFTLLMKRNKLLLTVQVK